MVSIVEFPIMYLDYRDLKIKRMYNSALLGKQIHGKLSMGS